MDKKSKIKLKLQKRLKIVYTALARRNRWFTGLSIKKYLKRNIFKFIENFNNTAINSGRWSSYCHYSLLKSFQNLLDKNEIQKGSKVLVHPLLPSSLLNELVERECQIFSLDISKETLNFSAENFYHQIDLNPFDLIIHYAFNGLYEELIDFTLKSGEKIIPSIFIIDNFEINISLLQLFEKHLLGGVIWNFGDSFWDKQLDIVLDFDLPIKKWFISWQLENRTKSVLEYHLSDSQDNYIPILESYFYLLLENYPFLDFHKIYYSLYRFLFLKKSISSPQQAVGMLNQNYQKIFNSAIPDLVFDLQLSNPVSFKNKDLPNELIKSAAGIQQETKKLSNYFLDAVKKRPVGSLEIPPLFLNKCYLKYFIYTTESVFWNNHLNPNDIETFQLGPLDPFFQKMNHLPNAQFVTEYGVFIDVFNVVDKILPKLNTSENIALNLENKQTVEAPLVGS